MTVNENSFYDKNDPKSKDAFEKSPTKLGNAFWINFLGFCALYDIDKKFPPLHTYLNKKVRIRSITDDSNDLMLIIKILHMKSIIPSPVVTELTRLLVRLKSMTDDKINQVLLRKLCKKVPITKVKPSAKLKPYIMDFVKGVESLETVVDPMYNWARQQKTNEEFRLLCRKMKTSIAATDFDGSVKPTASFTPKPAKPKKDPAGSITGKSTDYQTILDTMSIDKDFPYIKGNKDLAKLFFLKMVNHKWLWKIRAKEKNFLTHLKKNKTTTQDLMNMVSDEDFENMHKNKFPENHPVLKEFPNRDKIFSPISQTFFTSFESDEWFKVFPYKYFIKQKYKGKSLGFNGYGYNRISLMGVFDKWDKSDLDDMKDEITKSTIESFMSNPSSFLRTLDSYINLPKYITPILYNNKEFIFRGVAQFAMESIITEFYDWTKKYYEQAPKQHQDEFRAKLFMYNLLDKAKWIKTDTDDQKQMVYQAFKQRILTKGRSYEQKFLGSNPIDWLKSKGHMVQFLKDFETEEFDTLCVFQSGWSRDETDFLLSMESIVIKRKRPFVWKDKSSGEDFLRNAERLKDGSPLKSMLLKQFVSWIVTTKITVDSFRIDALKNFFNESNWLTFHQNNVVMSTYSNTLTFDSVSTLFIEENLQDILDLYKGKEFGTFDIFQQVASDKGWLIFGKERMEELFNRTNRTWRSNSLKNDLFSILVTDKVNQPASRYKELYDLINQRFKDNPDELSGLISFKRNLESPDFRKYAKDNFKDYIQDSRKCIATLSYQHLEPELLWEIFDGDEMEVAKALAKYGTNSQNYLLLQLKNFKDVKAITYLMKERKGDMDYYLSKTNMPTLLSEYGMLDVVEQGLDDLTPTKFDELIDALFGSKKLTTVINGIRQKILSSALIAEIYDDKRSLIQPIEKLTRTRINQVLRFNNVSIKMPPGMRRKKNEKLKPYLNRVKKNTGMLSASEPLHIDEIKETEEQLEVKSVEYMKYYNNNHGNSAIEFLQSFNVSLVNDEHATWIKEHPKPTVIPAFHGTGSIGASMILRYGFKVLKSSDKSVVGRMLGDGIYVSDIIEKAAQYIGDHGFSRREGTIGYILETECYLGEKDTHYRSAGVSGDRIRSPEYCLFDARSQIKIVKAHKVKMVGKNYLKSLKKKHKQAVKDSNYFSQYDDNNLLFEKYDYLIGEGTKKLKNVIDYIFYDGEVIDIDGKLLDFDEFDKKYEKNGNVYVSPGQLGPVVSVRTSADIVGSVHIPSTHMFQNENPENLYDKYLTILNDAINPTDDDWG